MTREEFKEFIGVTIFFGFPFWAVLTQVLG